MQSLDACVKIGSKFVGQDQPCFIVAEIGINHEGSYELAESMIDLAAEAGVDCVKIQVVNPETLYRSQDENPAVYQLFKAAQLTVDSYCRLRDRAMAKNLLFLGSSNDRDGYDMLDTLDVPAFKIASTHVTNLPLLQYLAKKNKPIILSTGMATIGEIEHAVNTLTDNGCNDVILLYCVANYPTHPKDIRLRTIPVLRDLFEAPVGFSDHSLSGVSSLLAVGNMNADLVERHVSVDPSRRGFDHHFSVGPDELKNWTQMIREATIIGTNKGLGRSNEEMGNRRSFRLSLVANVDIPKGVRITEDMIGALRPGTGIEPKYLSFIVGRKATRSLSRNDPISWADV